VNLDLLVFKLFLQDTECWLKYHKYINTKHSGIYNKIYHTITKLKEDGKSEHSVAELSLKFHVCYPVLSAMEAEAFSDIVQEVANIQIESGQAEELLTSIRQRAIAERLALTAVEVASGDTPWESLRAAALELEENVQETEEEVFLEDDIVKIQERFVSEPPFAFRLRTLNAILGGLHRRTFGFFFARPEIGKTQLLVSEATFLAGQVPSGILWINNEEDGTALITRCYQAALKVNSHELFKNPQKAREAYKAATGGRIWLYDRPEATTGDIEALVRRTKPDVVFIDQLDKVRGGKAERYDLLQKALYQWARELAKKYNCAVVGICQAGGSAEGKRYLDMNDVDSSHTAKQGEADWMFGLGASTNTGEEDRRYISVCKNKLPQSPSMVSSMRHAKVPIKSIPELQIYEDVLNVQ
jgi:replicative DNA helicase